MAHSPGYDHDPPASTSGVLSFQVWTIMPGYKLKLLNLDSVLKSWIEIFIYTVNESSRVDDIHMKKYNEERNT